MNFALLVSNLPFVYDQLAQHAPSQLARPVLMSTIARTVTRWLGLA
jgi:hypothetical protein